MINLEYFSSRMPLRQAGGRPRGGQKDGGYAIGELSPIGPRGYASGSNQTVSAARDTNRACMPNMLETVWSRGKFSLLSGKSREHSNLRQKGMVRQFQSGEKWNTPLRQAQRDLTRDRIKSAARRLFYETHYDSTTMDEIALAAGLRRSTLYLHYRDKSEILADVIADYTPKAKAVMAKLPGPKPSMKELNQWLKKVERFAAKELVPLSILQELRSRNQNPAAVESVICELLSGLGENNPIFLESSREDGDPMIRARGLMLLQELAYAFEIYFTNKSDARGKALLQVLAEDYFEFLSGSENR